MSRKTKEAKPRQKGSPVKSKAKSKEGALLQALAKALRKAKSKSKASVKAEKQAQVIALKIIHNRDYEIEQAKLRHPAYRGKVEAQPKASLKIVRD